MSAESLAFHTTMGLEPSRWADPATPLVVTGHQPELYHPGVWAKNFAASAISRSVGSSALNLIVDNDVPHSAAIRVPTLHNGELRTVLVDFDVRTDDSPFEDWKVRDESRFSSFAHRVLSVLHPGVCDPLLNDFWPIALERKSRTDRIGLRFVVARHALERRFGIANNELPLSHLCETEAFHWFVAHVLAQLPRFRSVHNACLDRYRQKYGVRSQHHPVSALRSQGEWREGPFWVWRGREPRRRPLMVRQRGRVIDLRASGEDEPFLELPLAPEMEGCCAVERLRELPAKGIRLRTRALTTTMFTRLFLADLFIHGIGGARYDELGDEIVREFFKVEPPGFLTFTMTLWLGLPTDPATQAHQRELEHALRDLEFNPDRHLSGSPSEKRARAIASKHAAIAGSTATSADRVARYFAIRRANETLRVEVATQRDCLAESLQRVKRGLEWNRIARGREFAFVLHNHEELASRFEAMFPGQMME